MQARPNITGGLLFFVGFLILVGAWDDFLRPGTNGTPGHHRQKRQSKNKAQTEPEQHQESARHDSCDTGQGSGTKRKRNRTTRRGGLASSNIVRQANSCLPSLSSCWRTQPDWPRADAYVSKDRCLFVPIPCRMTTP